MKTFVRILNTVSYEWVVSLWQNPHMGIMMVNRMIGRGGKCTQIVCCRWGLKLQYHYLLGLW